MKRLVPSDVQRLPNCRDEDQDLDQTFGLETGEAEIVAYRLKSRPIIWPQDRVQTFDLETRACERIVSGAVSGRGTGNRYEQRADILPLTPRSHALLDIDTESRPSEFNMSARQCQPVPRAKHLVDEAVSAVVVAAQQTTAQPAP